MTKDKRGDEDGPVGFKTCSRRPADIKIRVMENPKLPEEEREGGSRTLSVRSDLGVDGTLRALRDMIDRYGAAYSEDIRWADQDCLDTEE